MHGTFLPNSRKASAPRPRRQMSEAFVTAAVLSLSGGLQDAYTYLSRGKVFANAQTGNIVLFSTNLFEGRWPQAVHYLIPLLFFAFGVAAAQLIRQAGMRGAYGARRMHWRQIVVLAEILLLFLVGFFPGSANLPANALVSFSCAIAGTYCSFYCTNDKDFGSSNSYSKNGCGIGFGSHGNETNYGC